MGESSLWVLGLKCWFHVGTIAGDHHEFQGTQTIKQSIWGTAKSSICRWIFPCKPSSYWGTPMTMETPIWWPQIHDIWLGIDYFSEKEGPEAVCLIVTHLFFKKNINEISNPEPLLDHGQPPLAAMNRRGSTGTPWPTQQHATPKCFGQGVPWEVCRALGGVKNITGYHGINV